MRSNSSTSHFSRIPDKCTRYCSISIYFFNTGSFISMLILSKTTKMQINSAQFSPSYSIYKNNRGSFALQLINIKLLMQRHSRDIVHFSNHCLCHSPLIPLHLLCRHSSHLLHIIISAHSPTSFHLLKSSARKAAKTKQ